MRFITWPMRANGKQPMKTRPPTADQQTICATGGFIHFSTAEQPRRVAKHRAGQRDLLLISVDPAKLGDALVWEESRDGALFPHLYGNLDPSIAEAAIAPSLGRYVKGACFPAMDGGIAPC